MRVQELREMLINLSPDTEVVYDDGISGYVSEMNLSVAVVTPSIIGSGGIVHKGKQVAVLTNKDGACQESPFRWDGPGCLVRPQTET